MDITEIIPLAGAAAFVLVMVHAALRGGDRRIGWQAPAILAAVFSLFSLYVVVVEGPLAFWTEHVLGLWGNQIWLDLLLALGMTLCLMMPDAKRLGMQPVIWVVITCFTGSIGVLAMMARLNYIKSREEAWS